MKQKQPPSIEALRYNIDRAFRGLIDPNDPAFARGGIHHSERCPCGTVAEEWHGHGMDVEFRCPKCGERFWMDYS